MGKNNHARRLRGTTGAISRRRAKGLQPLEWGLGCAAATAVAATATTITTAAVAATTITTAAVAAATTAIAAAITTAAAATAAVTHHGGVEEDGGEVAVEVKRGGRGGVNFDDRRFEGVRRSLDGRSDCRIGNGRGAGRQDGLNLRHGQVAVGVLKTAAATSAAGSATATATITTTAAIAAALRRGRGGWRRGGGRRGRG
jgi:hypothetical protein